ncbi:10057_t:CDS:1, partial [Funneliformis geosporum]
ETPQVWNGINKYRVELFEDKTFISEHIKKAVLRYTYWSRRIEEVL